MKEQPLTPDTPAFKKCQNKIRLFLLATLALLFFFLPLSSTGKSLFLGLSTVFTLMLMYQRKKEALETIKHPLSILALTFLGWALIATLWSPAYSGEKLDLLKHYSKLLFIPLFLFAFRDEKSQKWSIHAFLLAMLVTFLISLLNISGLTHWYSLDPTAMFQNHIMTSFMMAIACFITATYAKKSEKHRWFYGTLAGLFAVHILFMNTGRMGYIIFFHTCFYFSNTANE